MSGAAGLIFNGLVALILSLVLWHISHSFLGWLVLFGPGAALVMVGWIVLLRDK